MQTAKIIQESGIHTNPYVVAWIIGILVGVIAFFVGVAYFFGARYFKSILDQIKKDQEQVGKDVHMAIAAYQGVINEILDSIKLRMMKCENNVEELFDFKNDHERRIVSSESDLKHIQKEHDKNHNYTD